MQLKAWDDQFDTEATNVLLLQIALWHLDQITDEVERNRLGDLLGHLDFVSLCTRSFPLPSNASDAYHVSQIIAFFKKRADLDLGIDKAAVALEKFRGSESLCEQTNIIFKQWQSGGFHFPKDVEAVLFSARQKICSVLGDVPSLSDLHLRFGPGSTTQIPKRKASARAKLSETFACSEDLVPYVSDVLSEVPAWIPFGESESAVVPVVVHHGKLEFVPKNAKTHRSIVVEPVLNSFCQLGIGDHIARCLRRFGVDIKDQTRNQRLAREGSITGDLATLDLSSASDTIAIGLVEHLLPPDWFEFLLRYRTSRVEHKGEVFKLHKFSSMGNGFTFPLETLIFWSLSKASVDASRCRKVVAVYGDDIIVPVDAVDLLARVLNACGFILNKDKSYASGPFRESCGKDYFSGIDIRPVFVKDRLRACDLYILHNYYVRNYMDAPARIVRASLDPTDVLVGPDGYGDGHLVTRDFDVLDAAMTPIRRNGYGGYTFETYTWKSRKSFRPLPGDYVYPCYSIYVRYDEDVTAEQSQGALSELYRVWSYLDADRDSGPHPVQRGRWGVVLPGTKGYKRVKIYTLTM